MQMNRIIANFALNVFWTVEIQKIPSKPEQLDTDELEGQFYCFVQEVICPEGSAVDTPPSTATLCSKQRAQYTRNIWLN